MKPVFNGEAGAVRREEGAVLNDHAGGVDFRVEETSVPLGIPEILRVADEDSAVIWRRTVGVADPVQLAVHEVDPAALVP